MVGGKRRVVPMGEEWREVVGDAGTLRVVDVADERRDADGEHGTETGRETRAQPVAAKPQDGEDQDQGVEQVLGEEGHEAVDRGGAAREPVDGGAEVGQSWRAHRSPPCCAGRRSAGSSPLSLRSRRRRRKFHTTNPPPRMTATPRPA